MARGENSPQVVTNDNATPARVASKRIVEGALDPVERASLLFHCAGALALQRLIGLLRILAHRDRHLAEEHLLEEAPGELHARLLVPDQGLQLLAVQIIDGAEAVTDEEGQETFHVVTGHEEEPQKSAS